MKLYTFMGNSPAEALQKAQNVCGKDALVVSTKQLKRKTISSPALHEVVVALESKDKSEAKLDSQKPKDDLFLDISNQAKELAKNAQPKIEKLSNAQEFLESKDFAKLQQELDRLNEKIDSITNLIWQDRSSRQDDPAIPPEFASIYNQARRSGMAKEHLEKIINMCIKEMPTYMKNSPKTIERYFQVLLKKMIPIRNEKFFVQSRDKIMMLVGPTGVGKTTTLAKLAARYSFLEYDLKVGIITLDSYRIGAVEQLYSYAKMMKLPIESVLDMHDFKRALDRLSYCDIILIDTIGSSQFDKEKITKIASLIDSIDKKIDVSLVLSASTKLDDLRDSYDNFSFLELDNLIITKFDESRSFGNIFSITLESDLALSYFCMGQEVPDDLMTSSDEFLVDAMLNGYKKGD